MRLARSAPRIRSLAAVAVAGVILSGSSVFLNHPILVEGNCPGPAARDLVLPTATVCGDYDGDGRIGLAEDNDEPDRIFGTINGALGPGLGAAAGTGANQNGKVTIVRSGIYPEVVTITAANGNVTLEAAPGVEATIDAVLQGQAGNGPRQDAPGVIVNAPTDRYVVLRNLSVRNFTRGIQVLGDSRVAIESVRLENNTDFGVEVRDDAHVTIAKSEVHGTGRRVGGPTPRSPVNDFPRAAQPMPGTGIEYTDGSSGTVFFTTVSGSFAAGIEGSGRARVCVSHVNVFDNNPNLRGVQRGEDDRNNHCEDRNDR